MLEASLNEEQLDALRRLDTCTVSNAIERFGVRLRNTGFADASVRCIFGELPPLLGYAATARLRTDDPPIDGVRYHDRADWWRNIIELPPPRVIVVKDMDRRPGVGAFLGDMHASILQALGCVGYVTNGAVRELEPIHRMKFHLFAGNVAVSHAYAHIFDFGSTVDVGGMLVRPGDLLHGDRHGILTVPKEIAADIPPVAMRLLDSERKIIDFCRSDQFSIEGLRERMKELDWARSKKELQ